MSKTSTSLPTIHPQELAQKANEIYSRIKNKLEKESYGKFVAIEVDSGEYFIAERQDEALKKAKSHFPQKIFYILRIGFPGAISLSTSYHPPYYESIL